MWQLLIPKEQFADVCDNSFKFLHGLSTIKFVSDGSDRTKQITPSSTMTQLVYRGAETFAIITICPLWELASIKSYLERLGQIYPWAVKAPLYFLKLLLKWFVTGGGPCAGETQFSKYLKGGATFLGTNKWWLCHLWVKFWSKIFRNWLECNKTCFF